MTISSNLRKAGPFSGNGATIAFPFAYKVFATSDVVVTKSDGVTETTLTLTTDYTVALNPDQNANPGGTVTYPASGSPLPVGQTLTLSSSVPELQQTSITNQGGFYPKIIEDALDRLTIFVQQFREILGRSLRFPVSDPALNITLPTAAQRANNLLGFDPAGNVIAVIPSAQSAAALQTILADQVDATKGATLIGYLGGTLRAYLNQFITSAGASIIGWIQSGTGAALRLVQDKLRDSVSVADFGADSTGVADSSTAFSNAGTAASTVHVKDGTYLLNSDVTSTATYILGAAVSFTGTGVLYAAVNRPHTSHYPARKKTLGDAMKKAHDGTAITIACYGDSLTYGQDVTGTGTGGAINGASQTRSPCPYPEMLQESIGFAGFSGGVTVANRGFPGDTSAQGVTRWKSASATDVAILMFGHNDANNYGGTGLVSIPNFRRNMSMIIEREIVKGAAVILMAPPPVKNIAQHELIRPYGFALKQLATEYGIPFIDAAEQLSSVTSLWTDNVHLTSFAYAELGWHLAALFLKRDGAITHVIEGSLYYPTDFVAHGGALFTNASAKANATLQSLAAGQTFAVGVYCEDDVLPVLHSFNSSGSPTGPLTMYYSGGLSTTRGVANAKLTHDDTRGIRQRLTGPMLRRGYRTLYIRNDGATTAYIEAIEFAPLSHLTMSIGALVKSDALSSTFQPATVSNAQVTWWAAVDYSRRLTAPCGFVARLTLNDTGVSGLGIFKSFQNQEDIMNGDLLLVLRNGTGLIIRELIAGTPAVDTTAAAIFAAGVWTGEIEIALTAADCKVYIDGVLAATRLTPTTQGGYPGLFSHRTQRMACSGAYISGYVKGPF